MLKDNTGYFVLPEGGDEGGGGTFVVEAEQARPVSSAV